VPNHKEKIISMLPLSYTDYPARAAATILLIKVYSVEMEGGRKGSTGQTNVAVPSASKMAHVDIFIL
jgi:hypothetical protein